MNTKPPYPTVLIKQAVEDIESIYLYDQHIELRDSITYYLTEYDAKEKEPEIPCLAFIRSGSLYGYWPRQPHWTVIHDKSDFYYNSIEKWMRLPPCEFVGEMWERTK